MEQQDDNKIIEKFYKKWCKDTKRCGGVLIGPSIREVLIAFKEHLNSARNVDYNQ